MGLNEALAKLKFDKRLLDYHLKNNILKKEEVEGHLSKLEDTAQNSETLNLGGDKEDSSEH